MKTNTKTPCLPPRFALGQVVATPGALRLLASHQASPLDYLSRHVTGDWGSVPPDDAAANEEALTCGARILSSYLIGGRDTLWVITEADRSATTLLRPDEY